MKRKGRKQKEELSCPPPLLDASIPLEEETRTCVTSALSKDKHASHKNKHDEHCDCFGSMPVLEPIYGSNLQQAVVQNDSGKLTSCAKSTSSSGRSTPSGGEQTSTKVPQNSNASSLNKNIEGVHKSDTAIYSSVSSVISALKSVSSTPPSSPIPLVCLTKVNASHLASNATTSGELISDSVSYRKAESPALAKMHGKVIKGISMKTFKKRPKGIESTEEAEMSHKQAVQIPNSDIASNSACQDPVPEQVKSKAKTPKSTPKKKKRKLEKEQEDLDNIEIKKSASESCVVPVKKEKKRKIDSIAASKPNSGDHSTPGTLKSEQIESPKSCGDGEIADTAEPLENHQSRKCSGNVKNSPKTQKQKSPSPKRAYKVKTSEAEVLENMKQRKLYKLQQIQDKSPPKETKSNEPHNPQEWGEDLLTLVSQKSETTAAIEDKKSPISAKSGKKKQNKNGESFGSKTKGKKQDKFHEYAVKNGKMVPMQAGNTINSLMVFDGKKTVKYKTFLSQLHTDGATETSSDPSQSQTKPGIKDTKTGKKKKSLAKSATDTEIVDDIATSSSKDQLDESVNAKCTLKKSIDMGGDIVGNLQLSITDHSVTTPLQIDASPFSNFFDSRLSSPDSEEKKVSPHVTRSGRVASRLVLSSPVRRERLTISENSSPEKYEHLKSPSVETCSLKSKEEKIPKKERDMSSPTRNKHSRSSTPHREESAEIPAQSVGKRTPKKKLVSATKKKKLEESKTKNETDISTNLELNCEKKLATGVKFKRKKSLTNITSPQSEKGMSPLKETADKKNKKLKKDLTPKKTKGKKMGKKNQTTDIASTSAAEINTANIETMDQDIQSIDLGVPTAKITKTKSPKGKQRMKKKSVSPIIAKKNSSKPDLTSEEKNIVSSENMIKPVKSGKKSPKKFTKLSPKKITKLSPSPKKKKKSPTKNKSLVENDDDVFQEASENIVENLDFKKTDSQGPSKETEDNVDLKGPSKKTDANVDSKGPKKETEESVDLKGSSKETGANVDSKGSNKETEDKVNLTGPRKETEDNVDLKGPSKETEACVNSKGSSKETEDKDRDIKMKKSVEDADEKSKKDNDLEIEKIPLAIKPNPLARLISEMKVRLSTDESVSMSGESEQEFSSSEEEESSSSDEDSSENKEDTSFDTSASSLQDTDNSPEKKELVKGSPSKKKTLSQIVSSLENTNDKKEETLASSTSSNIRKDQFEPIHDKTQQVKDLGMEKDIENKKKEELLPPSSSDNIPSPSISKIKSTNINEQQKSCTVVTSDVVESHFAKTFANLGIARKKSEIKAKTLEAFDVPKIKILQIKKEPGIDDIETRHSGLGANEKEDILGQNTGIIGLKPKEENQCIDSDNVHKLFEKPQQKKSSAFISSELDQYLNENREINSQFICAENFDGGETAHVSDIDPANIGEEQHDMDEVDGIVFLSFGSQTSMETYEEKHKVKVEEEDEELDLDKTDDVKKIKGWKKKYGKQEEECLQLHWKALEKLVKPVCQDEMEVLGLTLRKSGKRWSCYSRKYEKKYKEKDYGKYIEPFDKDGLTEGYRGSVQRIYGRKSDGKFASKNTIKQRVSPKYGMSSMKQTFYGKHGKYSPESKTTRRELIKEHIKKGYGKERILMKSPKGRIRSLKIRGKKRYVKTPPHLRPVTLTQSMAEIAASAFSLTGKHRPYSARRVSYGSEVKEKMVDNECKTQEEKDTENISTDVSNAEIGLTDQQTPPSACSKDYCRLGCVCDSIDAEKATPDEAEKSHCRKPGCMLVCVCPSEEKEENVEDPNVRKSKRLKNVRRLTQIDALDSLVFFDTSYWLGVKPRKKIKPEQARLMEQQKRIGLEELQKVSKEGPIGEEPEILFPFLAETKGQAELDKKELHFEDEEEDVDVDVDDVEGLGYTFDEEEENMEDCARSSIYITRQRKDSDTFECHTFPSPTRDTSYQDSPIQVDVEPAPKSKRGRKKKKKMIPLDVMSPSTSTSVKHRHDKPRVETTSTNDNDCIIILDDDEEEGNDGEMKSDSASKQKDTDDSKLRLNEELGSKVDKKKEQQEKHSVDQDTDDQNSYMKRKSDKEQPKHGDSNHANSAESKKGSSSKKTTNFLRKYLDDKMSHKKGQFKTQMVLLQRKMKKQISAEGKPDTSDMSEAAKEAIKRLQCAINATKYPKETEKDTPEGEDVKKGSDSKESCSDKTIHSLDSDNVKDEQNKASNVSPTTETSTEKESTQEETNIDQNNIKSKSDKMQDTGAKSSIDDTKSDETSTVLEETKTVSALEKTDKAEIISTENSKTDSTLEKTDEKEIISTENSKVLDVSKSEDTKSISGECSSASIAEKVEENETKSDEKCTAPVSDVKQEEKDKSPVDELSTENAQTAQKSLPKESEINLSNSSESGDISCKELPANQTDSHETPPQEKNSNLEAENSSETNATTSPSKEIDSSAVSEEDQLRNIPHLLEIKSNCDWENSRTEILGKISFICDWCDYPRPSFFKVKGFVVKILPKPTKQTPIPKSLQSKLKAAETYTIRVLIVLEKSNETDIDTNEPGNDHKDGPAKERQNTDGLGDTQDPDSSNIMEGNETEKGGSSSSKDDGMSSGISGFGKFVMNIGGNVTPQTETNESPNKKKRGRPPGKKTNPSKKIKMSASTVADSDKNDTDTIEEGNDAANSKTDTKSKKKGIIASLSKVNNVSSPSLPLLPNKSSNGIPSAVSTVRVPLKWLQENMKLAAKGVNSASNLVVTGTRGEDGGEIQAMAQFVTSPAPSSDDRLIEASSAPVNYSQTVLDSELNEPINLVKREMKDPPCLPTFETDIEKTDKALSKLHKETEVEEIIEDSEDEEPIQTISSKEEHSATKENNETDDEEDVDIISCSDSTGGLGLYPLRPEHLAKDIKMMMEEHDYHSPGPQMNWGSKLKLQESSSEPMSPSSSSTNSSSDKLALHSKREKVRRYNMKTLFSNLRELVLPDETGVDPNKCPKIFILRTAMQRITKLRKKEASLLEAKEQLRRTQHDLERRISILGHKKPRIKVRLLGKPQASDSVSTKDSVHFDLTNCESDIPCKTDSSSVDSRKDISNSDKEIEQVEESEKQLESFNQDVTVLDSDRDMSDREDCEMEELVNKPQDSDAPLGLVIEKVESLQNSAFDADQDNDQGINE